MTVGSRKLLGRVLVFLIAALLLPSISWGWGYEGHQIIATVAENHLDQTTLVMIQSLLGNNHLYSVSSWADDVRRERPETKGWHYVDIPLGDKYNASRDCAPPNSCVVVIIEDFLKVLIDKSATRDQRAEALKFIVHFVGDIHQPLHVAALYLNDNGEVIDPDAGGNRLGQLSHGYHDTAGGNDIVDGKKLLHGEWDAIPPALEVNGALAAQVLQQAKMVPATRGDLLSWSTTWATDSIQVGKQAFSGLHFTLRETRARTGTGTDAEEHKAANAVAIAVENAPEKWNVTGIDAAYQNRADQIKLQQLAKAGARLAQVLKAIWPD